MLNNKKVESLIGSVLPGLAKLGVEFVFPMLMLSLVVVILWFYLIPTNKKIASLEVEIGNKKNQADLLRAKAAQLSLLKENRDLVFGDLEKISWVLNEGSKVPELTKQVVLMSKDAGLELKGLDYSNQNFAQISYQSSQSSENSDTSVYKEDKLNVSIEGKNFMEIVNFLNIAENSIRLFRFDSFNIVIGDEIAKINAVMVSPYLNVSDQSPFHYQNSVPIDLNDADYRMFMDGLNNFRNYAKDVDLLIAGL